MVKRACVDEGLQFNVVGLSRGACMAERRRVWDRSARIATLLRFCCIWSGLMVASAARSQGQCRGMLCCAAASLRAVCGGVGVPRP